MRLLTLALLVLAVPVLAQGMPPAKRADMWRSPHNQKRLKQSWDVLPPFKPTKNPDGTEDPPKAPWPFIVYVYQQESKGSAKLQEKVFADARFILATHAVRIIKLKPHKALDVPYLAGVQGIKDPTMIFVDRDFKVVGVLKSAKDFTDKKVFGFMGKQVKAAYETKLGAYVGSYFKLMLDGEKLWKQETKMDQLRGKAAKADKGKAAKYDKEADEIEAALGPAMAKIEDLEVEVQDSLVLKGANKKEALPETFGSGKKRRKLTPQELEAIETYREFKKNENPIVRAAAVEDLGSIDSGVMVAVILKASNDVDQRVVEAAGKALGKMKSDESLEAMTAGLSGGKAKARTAAVLGFASITRAYPPAVPKIASMAKSGPDEIRRAAIKALHNMKDPAGGPALIKALDDNIPALRVIAAEACGDLRLKDAGPALIGKLESSDWSMRKTAVEALAKIRVKEAVGPILKLFETEKGLMEEIAQKALVSITGQDFLYNRENWRKWWDKYGHGFKLPSDAEIAIAKKKAEEALKGYYDPNKRKYHKIETLSRKMVFVLDISASMKDKIVIPPYAPDKVKEEFPDRVKMNIAKKELIDLLATLDGKVYFNIITFAGRVKPWRDGLVSGSARTSAIKFVAKLKPMEPPRGSKSKKASGGEETKTNTYGALMAAFGLQDEAVANWKSRSKVDTIFLVTDGDPTKGTITDVPKLIDAITDLNRSRGVVLHVIVFGKEEAMKLGPLAKRNGGQIVMRAWDGKR